MKKFDLTWENFVRHDNLYTTCTSILYGCLRYWTMDNQNHINVIHNQGELCRSINLLESNVGELIKTTKSIIHVYYSGNIDIIDKELDIIIYNFSGDPLITIVGLEALFLKIQKYIFQKECKRIGYIDVG